MHIELIQGTERYLLIESDLAKYVAEYIKEEWDRGMSIDNIQDIVENALKAYHGGAR